MTNDKNAKNGMNAKSGMNAKNGNASRLSPAKTMPAGEKQILPAGNPGTNKNPAVGPVQDPAVPNRARTELKSDHIRSSENKVP
jgi:hypothetical protein